MAEAMASACWRSMSFSMATTELCITERASSGSSTQAARMVTASTSRMRVSKAPERWRNREIIPVLASDSPRRAR
jgi:hypothetical protein